jgi:hypothetical protein
VKAQYQRHCMNIIQYDISLFTPEDTRWAFCPLPALFSSPRHTLDHLGVCLRYHLEQPRTSFGEDPVGEGSSAIRLISSHAASQDSPTTECVTSSRCAEDEEG